MRFDAAQQFDVRVLDANDRPIWRWGAGQAFAQMAGTCTRTAGEVFMFTAHWSPLVGSRYQAMAYLSRTSNGAVPFASVEFPRSSGRVRRATDDSMSMHDQ